MTIFMAFELLRLIREGNLQPSRIIFIKAVILQRLHSNRTCKGTFKVHKAEVKLSSTLGLFLDQPNLNKPWKRSKDIYLKPYEPLHVLWHQ